MINEAKKSGAAIGAGLSEPSHHSGVRSSSAGAASVGAGGGGGGGGEAATSGSMAAEPLVDPAILKGEVL